MTTYNQIVAIIKRGDEFDNAQCDAIDVWFEQLNDMTDAQRRGFKHFIVKPDYDKGEYFVYARLTD